MRFLATIFSFCLIINFCISEEEFFTINGKKVLNIVSERFLSFSLDPVVLLTGLNLSDSSLQLAKHLSPAFIRLAGPSTEFVKYIDNEYDYDGAKDGNNATNVIVTPSMWFGVNEWLSLANLTPVFGINDLETDGGKWDPKSTVQLLELSDKLNVSCFWQLGFDCSNKGEPQYKEDIQTLHKTLEKFPEKTGIWRIVASDLSRCQSQDSLDNLKRTLNDIEDMADVVMWEPKMSNKKDLMSKILPNTESKLQFWTTTPKDLRPVNFSTAILWAQQIGDSAKTGYSVTLRQPRLHEMFSVTPVYWTSLLHKTFMGRVVLDIKKPFSFTNAHVYAHCTKKQNQFVRRGAMTVMIVNNQSEAYTAFVRLGNPYLKNIEIQTYLLTSPNENSTEVFLNGNLLDEKLLKEPKVTITPKLRRANAAKPINLEVPPKSIAFFVLPGAKIPACIKYEETEQELIKEIDQDQQLPLSEELGLKKKKVKSRSSFHTLRDLQSLLEKELHSDEQYYKKSRGYRPDILGSRMLMNNDKNRVAMEKPSEAARNLFIERVKLAEKLKKPKDFDFKFDNILKELGKLQHGGDLLRQEKPKITTLDLSSSETTKILRDRARIKAARKNVMFTSKELDELFSRSNKNSKYPKFKRSLPKNPLDTLKMKWEEQKDNWIVKAHDLKEQYEEQLERLRGNDFNSNFEKLRMKYNPTPFNNFNLLKNKYSPRYRRSVDFETHWNNLKEQLQGKQSDVLGIDNLMDKIDEQREKIKMTLELDALQRRFVEAKDKILEAINLDDIKSKVQDAHAAVLKQIDGDWKQKFEDAKDKILQSVNIDDLKDKVMSTWDDQKEKLLSSSRQFFRRKRAVNTDKLDALKSKMQRMQRASLLRSRLRKNISPLRRVKKEINMNLLNLKSRADTFKIPSFKTKSGLLQKPLEIDTRTSEEFMSSSDEIKFNDQKPRGMIVAPKTRKPISALDLFKTKARLSHKPKPNQHSCEEEIFGRGLAHVNGKDLFDDKKDRELDDCIKHFNEKNSNANVLTTRLSDYLRNPLGMQKIEDMDLSLYDDVFRKKRDAEKEVTPEEVEDRKTALQKKIADLHEQMASDRKQLQEDRRKLQEERKIALNERLQKMHSLSTNMDRKIVGLTKNTVDNDKLKKLDELKTKLLSSRFRKDPDNIVGAAQIETATDKTMEKMAQFKVAQPTLEELRQRRTEMLKAMQEKLSKTNKNVNISSRLGDMGLENMDSQKVMEDLKKSQDQILGEIEQKRKQIQKEASLREIDFLKKRLESRQQLLDKLTGGDKEDPETPEDHVKVGEIENEPTSSTVGPLFKPLMTTAKSVELATESSKPSQVLAKPELNLKSLQNTKLPEQFKMKNNLLNVKAVDGGTKKEEKLGFKLKPEGTKSITEEPEKKDAKDENQAEDPIITSIHTLSDIKDENNDKPITKEAETTTKSIAVEDDKIIRVKMANNGRYTEDKIKVEPNTKLVDKLAAMEDKVEEKMEKTVQANTVKEGTTPLQELVKVGSDVAKQLEEKVDKKTKRSITVNGKTFGDYKSKTLNLRKWRPEDMLTLPRVHMMSRSSFKPEEDNNIYRSFTSYNRKNNNLKSKRSLDMDADSRENDIDNTINEITKSESENTDTILKNNNVEKTNKISKNAETPSITVVDDRDYKLKSFNDVKENNSIAKVEPRQQSYEYIQKILPKDEQKAITKFFSNLKGLLQSIGKKLETSFKSMFN
ncbi:unnamed protein product [Brassicogethes aeneus]|uniref:Heparanase n=1 Tax=Brassicogethes aeneus TaxID=1431903 RepID=A0A9P0B3D9_BRAAE|nr:unnamed protein product [Brassicogethes aeneus]